MLLGRLPLALHWRLILNRLFTLAGASLIITILRVVIVVVTVGTRSESAHGIVYACRAARDPLVLPIAHALLERHEPVSVSVDNHEVAHLGKRREKDVSGVTLKPVKPCLHFVDHLVLDLGLW